MSSKQNAVAPDHLTVKESRKRPTLLERVNIAIRQTPVWLVYIGGMIPSALLIYAALTGGLGPDPVERLLHQFGLYGLQFLVAVICVTPLRTYAGINLMKFRRALGVLVFVYIGLHVATWLVLDVQFNWGVIFKGVLTRPYISIGFVSFAMLALLAITSNNASVRRMGATGWQRLHMLTYPAAILAGLHFVLLTKTWQLEPMLYLGGIIALLISRKRIRRMASGLISRK